MTVKLICNHCGAVRDEGWLDQFNKGASYTLRTPRCPSCMDPEQKRALLESLGDPKPESTDNVNSPKHYTFGKIEVITVIEDWGLSFHIGNALKYLARAKHKGNEMEDLKKCAWHVQRAIEQLEKSRG